jgi:hypothetical protein
MVERELSLRVKHKMKGSCERTRAKSKESPVGNYPRMFIQLDFKGPRRVSLGHNGRSREVKKKDESEVYNECTERE